MTTKRLFLTGLMGLAILGAGIATVSAQAPDGGTKLRPRAGIAAKLARRQVQRGVRAGTITPEQVAQLRTEAQALRAKLRAIRESGQRPTPAQRQELKQQLQQLKQSLAAARGKGKDVTLRKK